MIDKAPLDAILSHLPPRLRAPLERTRGIYESAVQEITLRAGRPLCLYCREGRYYLAASGCLTRDLDSAALISVTGAELQEILLHLCDYSVYSRQDELNRGFVTIAGGARVGVCGSAVYRDGRVVNIRRFTTISFRVPREVKGCGETVLGLVNPLDGVLVCGPPCSGKTTLIRDMARLISYRCRVSVIDERGELAAGTEDRFSYDMGLSDVYLYMPKGEGVFTAIRTMAPEVIVCDELGDESDVAAVSYALRCGAALIATVHASSLDDLKARAATRPLLSTGAFRYLVFLSDRRSSGTVRRIVEWRGMDA